MFFKVNFINDKRNDEKFDDDTMPSIPNVGDYLRKSDELLKVVKVEYLIPNEGTGVTIFYSKVEGAVDNFLEQGFN